MEPKPKKKNIAETVRALVKDAVEECGCILWDVTYEKDPEGWNLVICIDRDGGVSLTDCEMVNDAVGPILDEADPIDGSYFLEVSSPGIERELRTHDHIDAYLGSKVRVKLYAAQNGPKHFIAELAAHDAGADTVTLKAEDGTETVFERKAIAKLTTIADL